MNNGATTPIMRVQIWWGARRSAPILIRCTSLLFWSISPSQPETLVPQAHPLTTRLRPSVPMGAHLNACPALRPRARCCTCWMDLNSAGAPSVLRFCTPVSAQSVCFEASHTRMRAQSSEARSPTPDLSSWIIRAGSKAIGSRGSDECRVPIHHHTGVETQAGVPVDAEPEHVQRQPRHRRGWPWNNTLLFSSDAPRSLTDRIIIIIIIFIRCCHPFCNHPANHTSIFSSSHHQTAKDRVGCAYLTTSAREKERVVSSRSRTLSPPPAALLGGFPL